MGTISFLPVKFFYSKFGMEEELEEKRSIKSGYGNIESLWSGYRQRACES
jgi:hypothetical protein